MTTISLSVCVCGSVFVEWLDRKPMAEIAKPSPTLWHDSTSGSAPETWILNPVRQTVMQNRGAQKCATSTSTEKHSDCELL